MSKNYKDLEFGPVILTYTFEPGQPLPKVGEVMETDRSSMVVTESNQEHGYVKVLLTSTESAASRIERYRDEVETAMEDIAALLYKKTTTGMVARIGWENLDEETKAPFRKISKDIVLRLDDAGLLILKYSEMFE